MSGADAVDEPEEITEPIDPGVAVWIARLERAASLTVWPAIATALLLVATVLVEALQGWVVDAAALFALAGGAWMLFHQGLVPLVTGRAGMWVIPGLHAVALHSRIARLLGAGHALLGLMSVLVGIVLLGLAVAG